MAGSGKSTKNHRRLTKNADTKMANEITRLKRLNSGVELSWPINSIYFPCSMLWRSALAGTAVLEVVLRARGRADVAPYLPESDFIVEKFFLDRAFAKGLVLNPDSNQTEAAPRPHPIYPPQDRDQVIQQLELHAGDLFPAQHLAIEPLARHRDAAARG